MKIISICGTIILGSIVLVTVLNKNSSTPLAQEDKMTTERSICKSCQDKNDLEWIIQDKADNSSSDQKVIIIREGKNDLEWIIQDKADSSSSGLKVITKWIECGSGEEELDLDWVKQVGSPDGALLLDSSH